LPSFCCVEPIPPFKRVPTLVTSKSFFFFCYRCSHCFPPLDHFSPTTSQLSSPVTPPCGVFFPQCRCDLFLVPFFTNLYWADPVRCFPPSRARPSSLIFLPPQVLNLNSGVFLVFFFCFVAPSGSRDCPFSPALKFQLKCPSFPVPKSDFYSSPFPPFFGFFCVFSVSVMVLFIFFLFPRYFCRARSFLTWFLFTPRSFFPCPFCDRIPFCFLAVLLRLSTSYVWLHPLGIFFLPIIFFFSSPALRDLAHYHAVRSYSIVLCLSSPLSLWFSLVFPVTDQLSRFPSFIEFPPRTSCHFLFVSPIFRFFSACLLRYADTLALFFLLYFVPYFTFFFCLAGF